MGGVDKADMLLSLYRNKLKSPKAYRRLFHHCHDMALNNAWIVAKLSGIENLAKFQELYRFKLEVALALIRDGSVDVPPEVPQHLESDAGDDANQNQPDRFDPPAADHVSESCRLDGYWHFPKHVTLTAAGSQNTGVLNVECISALMLRSFLLITFFAKCY